MYFRLTQILISFHIMPQSCVLGCGEKVDRKSDPFISFHSFPNREKSPQRYSVWVNELNRENFTPTKNSVVCSLHFEDTDFESPPSISKNLPVKMRAALRKTAIPTQNLKRAPSCDQNGALCSKRTRWPSKYTKNKRKSKFVIPTGSKHGRLV